MPHYIGLRTVYVVDELFVLGSLGDVGVGVGEYLACFSGVAGEACELAAAVELHTGELLADAAHLLAYDDVGVGLGVGSCWVTEGVLGRC